MTRAKAMTIHLTNCFTCNARYPSRLRTGTLCLLVEADDGLILVDTGPGLEDYARIPPILRMFQVATRVPLDIEETAVHRVARLGFKPGDVRHIVLTHMHFDHCGGLPDFPHATIHVHEDEYRAFRGPPRRWTDFAYVRRHIAHDPHFVFYSGGSEEWCGLPAIPLPFGVEMWMIPLFGHSRGHCGLSIKTDSGWLFHVADAAPLGLDEDIPAWLTNLVLGPHTPRLKRFKADHPEIRMTTSHMLLDFFSCRTAAELFGPSRAP
jgi:glyoxylase-like metal-dependent hydrolase (beta-lactamase superfamily II)